MRKTLRRSVIGVIGLVCAASACAGCCADPLLAQSPPAGVVWPKVGGVVPERRLLFLAAPTLRLGTADGPEHSLFSGVVGAVRLSNGDIAVGDAGNGRVVFYDSRGNFLRSSGRLGSGPGEYRFLRWLGRCRDDTIAVYDAGHNTVTFLSTTGSLVASMALPSGLSFESPFWCSGSDQILVLLNKSRDRLRPGQHIAVPTAVVRVRGPSSIDTIHSSGVQEYYVARSIGAFIDVPLGRATLVAAGPNRIFAASNHDGRITVFDAAGAQRQTMAFEFSGASVGTSEWRRATQKRVEAEPLERTRRVLDVVVRELDQPATFPAFEELRADAADRLWIRTYDNYTTEVATWLVVTSTGRPIAVAATPRRFNVLDIGRDYVVGVVRDPEDVEQVLLYRFLPF